MRFLPREEKFFELFLTQVKLIDEAAGVLQSAAESGGSHSEAAARIGELGQTSDKVSHDIFVTLTDTFITPLDPEDIYSLSAMLDDIMDAIDAAAQRVAVLAFDPFPSAAPEIVRNVRSCVHAVEQGFQALHSDRKVVDHTVEANRLVKSVELSIHKAVGKAFEDPDPIAVMKFKDLCDRLERIADGCRRVSVELERVVVKNS